ncbi:MAG: serine/threonine-protein phosphatase, partial [Ardenticatenia bacterium]|nr:serine/threonine-protein phosphatase [Ardenticatenia bacterium]
MFHLEGKIEIVSGQTCLAGRKASNEDAVVLHVPDENRLMVYKGIVAAIADGVSSADAGKEAADLCTTRFVEDYYASPDVWTTKHSVQNVLTALNRDLYNRGKVYHNAEKGYLSTLSILILKSHTAHIFHIGDSRIYRLRDGKLEPLTMDHSVQVSETQSYLARAMGLDNEPRIDYSTTDVREDDLFLLTTDGIHDHVDKTRITTLLDSNRDDLQRASDMLVQEAFDMRSKDNLSSIVVRVLNLPDNARDEVDQRLT